MRTIQIQLNNLIFDRFLWIFNKSINYFKNDDVKYNIIENNQFFVSKNLEYIFYLTKTDGKNRTKLLNIKDEYYENKNLAKKWYREIAKFVHPDKNQQSNNSKNAFIILNKMYEVMTEDE